MKEKYIELLLMRCLKVQDCTSLFIHYNSINKDFVQLVVEYAKKIGINDIFLNEEDSNYIHDILVNSSIDEIKQNKVFNSAKWDEYANKNAAFLILDTEIPNIMNDVSSENLAMSAYIKRSTKPIYREKQMNSEIPWTIAAVPNIYWAKEIYPNVENPLEKFWDTLAKVCMLDKENPIEAWNKFLEKEQQIIDKLNNLCITKLYYKNSLGTDLTIELSDKALWQSASSNKWLVNMPSYEIFTTPDYNKTNGIVYSSKPLLYNGKMINNFKLVFENGKVIDYDAQIGKDVLKEIIYSDELSSFLGEVALVNYDSPISNSNIIFESTLFDENASCHLALGNGFIECIKNGDEMSKDELVDLGVNFSKNHVDFMIGTNDLIIFADTNKGKIKIMENGNLII